MMRVLSVDGSVREFEADETLGFDLSNTVIEGPAARVYVFKKCVNVKSRFSE
jgi:hypothetical protein